MSNRKPPGASLLPQISTKLAPPQNSAPLLARKRLIELMAVGQFKHLTVIQAPAGFGKTTLLTRYRQEMIQTGFHVAWLSLDEDDNDFLQFFAYVVASVQNAISGACLGTQALLQAGPLIPERAVISTLINELSSLDAAIFLILDDFHLIDQPEILKAIIHLLSHLPDNFHLVMASRKEPPLQLAKHRMRSQLLEIDAALMRFTLDESSQLLNELLGMNLTQGDINRLHDLTEGWAGGIQLASISLQKHKDRSAFIQSFSGNLQTIREYLAMDVLDLQPQPVVAFLLKTAILKRMDADLCNHVVGIENSRQILDQLLKHNLFIFPLDSERKWFRYHHLFSDFLKQRLYEDMPDQVTALHLSAAQWFKNKGLTEEAVYHAIWASQIPMAIALIEDCAMRLVEQGYMATLLGWIDKLPHQAIQNSPRITLATGWALCLTNSPSKAEEILDSIIAESDQIHPDILIEINAVRAMCAAFNHDIIRAEQLASRWIEKSEKENPWVVAVIGNILTYVYLQLGNFDKAREIQTWAQQYQNSAVGITSSVYGKGLLGLMQSLEGDLLEAARQYRQAIYIAQKATGSGSAITSLACALLYDLLYEWNQLDQASALLSQCHDLIDIGCPIDGLMACYIPLARALSYQNNMFEAFRMLDRLEDVSHQQKSSLLNAAVLHERIRILIARKDINRAVRIFKSNQNRKRRCQTLFAGLEAQSNELEQRTEARILLGTGKPQNAIAILTKLIGDAAAFGFVRRRIELEALLCIAYDQALEPSKAIQTLARALSKAKSQQMIRTFADEGPAMQSLILSIIKDQDHMKAYITDIDSESWQIYLKNLAEAFQAPSSLPQNDLLLFSALKNPKDTLIEPLSHRELEVLQVLSKGLTNKEIATALNMTVNTVKWHLKNVYEKLGVSTRTEAISEARQMGLLD